MITTHLNTVEDLLKIEGDWPRFELIEGVLIEATPPSPDHADIVTNVAGILRDQIRLKGLGRVYTGDPGVLLHRDPDTVLGPDVAVVTADRLPLEKSALMEIAPDWAIEVISPSNKRREIERKVGLFLDNGVKCVWIIYPDERSVIVHASDTGPRAYGETDLINGIEPFPTVSIQVSEFFE